MESSITIRVNGEARSLAIDTRTSLLDLLRERLGLTGAKKGCNEGACGTCTVLVDGRRMNGCLTLVVQCEGRSVTTVEGLAGPDGELHPVQQAFIDEQAAQCGYCLNGMIMTAKALLDRNPNPSEAEVRSELSGNLCRCGTHIEILRAVLRAARQTP